MVLVISQVFGLLESREQRAAVPRQRGLSPSSAYRSLATVPLLCLVYSLSTEQALKFLKAWHQLCLCQSKSVLWAECSAAPELMLQGFALGGGVWVRAGLSAPSACSDSLGNACWSANLSAFSLTAVWILYRKWGWGCLELRSFLLFSQGWVIVSQLQPCFLKDVCLGRRELLKFKTTVTKTCRAQLLWDSIWALWK